MLVTEENFRQEMETLTGLMNENENNQNDANEKLQLLKKFIEFMKSAKQGDHKHKMHHHGRHGKFGGDMEKHGFKHGKFGHGKHGHGKHGHGHGKHGHGLGKHGHGHGIHGDGFGKHCHGFGKHGHGFGKHGHGFGKHGHKHGLHHDHKGKCWARWTIDLTQNEEEIQSNDVVPRDLLFSGTDTETEQQNQTVKDVDCGFSRGHYHGRHGCRRGVQWQSCPFRRTNMAQVEVASQTEATQNVDDEANQENLTRMVENINIERTE